MKKYIEFINPRCHTCQSCKSQAGNTRPPVLEYIWSDLASDVYDVPKVRHLESRETLDYAFVIVCRLTGCILAISCQKVGLHVKKWPRMFLSCCAYFMGLPKEIMCDNASIINTDFFQTLCQLNAVEVHHSVVYGLESNGYPS